MNVELLIQRMIKAKVISGPNDEKLRRREFEPDEWVSLNPLVQEYFCLVAPRLVDRVLVEIEQQKQAAKQQAEKRARDIIDGKIDPSVEELSTDRDAVDVFLELYPQYVRDNRNRDRLLAVLHDAGRLPTDIDALIAAFEQLCARGELIIDLKPLGLGDRKISGYELKTHRHLDKIINPVRREERILSADEFRKVNDQRDRESGNIPPRSPRAQFDMDKMFRAWYDANPGFGVFENQTREDVKQIVFEYLDSEEIPWSVGAVAQAAEVLRMRGKIFRDSDAKWNGKSGEFTYQGATLVIHPAKANPVLNPPPQPIEIVERAKKITLRDLRNMSSAEYAEALRNPSLATQIEALLAQV